MNAGCGIEDFLTKKEVEKVFNRDGYDNNLDFLFSISYDF
jgi:hypothetical protein